MLIYKGKHITTRVSDNQVEFICDIFWNISRLEEAVKSHLTSKSLQRGVRLDAVVDLSQVNDVKPSKSFIASLKRLFDKSGGLGDNVTFIVSEGLAKAMQAISDMTNKSNTSPCCYKFTER